MCKKNWVRIASRLARATLLVSLILAMMPLCFTTGTVLAENPPGLQWQNTFGGPGYDFAYSVQQTMDGGYVLAGSTDPAGTGESSAWLIKTDAWGNVQWDKTFGSASSEARSVQQTADGGYVVGGPAQSGGASLIKTDVAGNKQWDKAFGGLAGASARSVQETADGGYVLAGWNHGAWLIKADASGNKEWDRTFGDTGYEDAYSVQQTADGGYVLAGYAIGSDIFFSTWLIKTDASGNVQWDKTFDGYGDDWANSVRQTMDGGFVLAGIANSFGTGTCVARLIKTDALGNEQWDKELDSGGWNDAGSVQQTADGEYVIAGFTGLNAGLPGVNDAWLIKTDAMGNKRWEKTFGGSDDDCASSVQQTADGGYVMAGYTSSYGAGGADAWLIKVSGNGLMEGDLSGNGHVTITDAMMIAQYKAGMITLTADQLLCADTNDDLNVTTADAMHIAQWLVDPTGSLGVLQRPLWESPADDSILPPQP